MITAKNTSKNIEQLIAISLLVLLIIGSYLVLQPFVSALLWAALLCYATWHYLPTSTLA